MRCIALRRRAAPYGAARRRATPQRISSDVNEPELTERMQHVYADNASPRPQLRLYKLRYFVEIAIKFGSTEIDSQCKLNYNALRECIYPPSKLLWSANFGLHFTRTSAGPHFTRRRRSNGAAERPFCALHLLHFCTSLINPHLDLEPDYIIRKRIKRRFQQYLVRTEIVSNFHTRVEYISRRTIRHSAHSNQWN